MPAPHPRALLRDPCRDTRTMLVFLTTARHDYTLKVFLEGRATALTRRVITMTYGEFLAWRELPSGHYILADVDRLRRDAREAVARRLDALVATRPELRVLNHPLHSQGRAALLQLLHRAGVNDFRAAAVGERLQNWRFPVFIRHSVDHTGPQTALIESQAALDEALRVLMATPGIDPADYLVVEYVDVRNTQGLHEKYSALRVGDRLFANDLSVNTHWVCKGEESEFSADEWLGKDLDLQNQNPHAAVLMPLFEMARIEYGRMDYGFSKGRLQVFEINTNPFVQPPDDVQPAFRPSLELRKRNFVDAMMAFDGPDEELPYFGPVSGALGPDRVEGPSALRRVLRAALRATRLLHWEHSLIRWRHRLRHRLKVCGPR